MKESEENQTSTFSYLCYREMNCEVGGRLKGALENLKWQAALKFQILLPEKFAIEFIWQQKPPLIDAIWNRRRKFWKTADAIWGFYSQTNYMRNFRVYWVSLYMFRKVFSSIIRSSRLYTQYQVCVIQVSWLLASKQSTNLYDIYLMLCVQPWTPDNGREDRPKLVEWYSINSKIVHLVGFTIEIKWRTSWDFF